ncbi:uncharacterized protein LOC105261957 [Musca domestica]|uniref:Uncharacterized protein LOC105261957 n=1 Tax=Musca domestica TaxID=7370 RepID=A0ABM3VC73_MUSDO|nr:uncharacterized protein LOC105261957 [Musca domestica]
MEKYEILTVIYHEKFNYVIADDRGLNRRCLRPQEFRELINTHGCEVVELKIISCYLLMEIFSNEAVENHLEMAKFPNLRKLELNGMSFTSEWLDMLSNCCGQLETLNLENCSNGQGAPVQLAVDIKLEILQKFPHLKKISLHSYDFYSLTIEYPKWQELLGNLPLQALHLNDRIIGESSTDNELSMRGQNTTAQLAELSLKTSLAREKWLEIFSKFLRNFEKLTTLRIEVLETITQQILQTLEEKCKKLQILQITNSTFYTTLSVISWPKNLKELALLHCGGLNFGNLQEILQYHPKLTKFISKSTEYQDEEVDNFQISPGLQSLEVDCKYLWQLQELSNLLHNNHIKELMWHHEKQNCQLSEKPIPAAETYGNLPQLQKLTIPHHMTSFGHITELLQHSSLEDLTVMHCGEYSEATCVAVPSVAALFQGNISELSIPLDIFNGHLDFWLDFFAKNSKMTILSCTFTFEDFEYSQFLKRLIENPLFPDDLKKLDIFGYTIDCNDLHNNFNALINKLENENCEDLYRIVLSKENKK